MLSACYNTAGSKVELTLSCCVWFCPPLPSPIFHPHDTLTLTEIPLMTLHFHLSVKHRHQDPQSGLQVKD